MSKLTVQCVFLAVYLISLVYCAAKVYEKRISPVKNVIRAGGIAFVLYCCHAILLYVSVSVASGFDKDKSEMILKNGGIMELAAYILFMLISITLTLFLWNHIRRLGDKAVNVLSILMFICLICFAFLGEWIAIQTAPTVLIIFLFVVGILMGRRQNSLEKQLELEEELRQMNEENQKELDEIRAMLENCRERAISESKTESAEYLKSLIEKLGDPV